MTDATFTFQVEEELKTAFSEAARAQDRSGPEVLRGFMREFVKHQQDAAGYDDWFRGKVKRAIDAADAGDLIPGDEVDAEFAQLREQTRKSSAR